MSCVGAKKKMKRDSRKNLRFMSKADSTTCWGNHCSAHCILN